MMLITGLLAALVTTAAVETGWAWLYGCAVLASLMAVSTIVLEVVRAVHDLMEAVHDLTAAVDDRRADGDR